MSADIDELLQIWKDARKSLYTLLEDVEHKADEIQRADKPVDNLIAQLDIPFGRRARRVDVCQQVKAHLESNLTCCSARGKKRARHLKKLYWIATTWRK